MGIVGDGAAASGFYAFDFDRTGADVKELELCFGGFGGLDIAKVVGGFEPLHLRECVLGVVQTDVHGFVNDGSLSCLYDGFHHSKIALEYEFDDFVVGCFEVGFFGKGTWGNVVGIEYNGDRVGGEVFNLRGVHRGNTMTIGLDLRNVKFVEGVIPNREYHFYHVAHVGIDFHHGTSNHFNGFIQGLLCKHGGAER